MSTTHNSEVSAVEKIAAEKTLGNTNTGTALAVAEGTESVEASVVLATSAGTCVADVVEQCDFLELTICGM
jgi:hypothetical protein